MLERERVEALQICRLIASVNHDEGLSKDNSGSSSGAVGYISPPLLTISSVGSLPW
jgi:hypothetical protein